MKRNRKPWSTQLISCLRHPSIIFGQDVSWHALRTVNPHVHDFFQIDYFYKGHGCVVINRKKYSVKPGDLFIANPDDRHGFQAARERPMEGITFKFTLGRRNRLLRFPNYVANLAELPGIQHRELESYLRRACAETNGVHEGHFEMAAALLSVFFVLLVRYLKPEAASNGNGEATATARVLEYIRANCDSPIRLKDLGELVDLHPRYLCQKFSRETGRSPLAVLTDARMERARHLLSNTRLPIHEVGIQSGYRDIYHFSKRFKAVIGVSPREFRSRRRREDRRQTRPGKSVAFR
jgi:AraC-like DNA-binding protein